MIIRSTHSIALASAILLIPLSLWSNASPTDKINSGGGGTTGGIPLDSLGKLLDKPGLAPSPTKDAGTKPKKEEKLIEEGPATAGEAPGAPKARKKEEKLIDEDESLSLSEADKARLQRFKEQRDALQMEQDKTMGTVKKLSNEFKTQAKNYDKDQLKQLRDAMKKASEQAEQAKKDVAGFEKEIRILRETGRKEGK